MLQFSQSSYIRRLVRDGLEINQFRGELLTAAVMLVLGSAKRPCNTITRRCTGGDVAAENV